MMNTTTLKFGGSSLGSAESMHQAADRIMEARLEGPAAVVVSAARPPNTNGTTNRLIALFHAARGDKRYDEEAETLLHMHTELLRTLGLPERLLDDDAATLLDALKHVECQDVNSVMSDTNRKLMDSIQTWGERTMHSSIFQPFLAESGIPSVAVNADQLIRTDSAFGEGKVQTIESYRLMQEALRPYLRKGIVPVIPGFYGADSQGNIVCLGRGASDYTGALVGRGIDAQRVDICTDQDGVRQVDPRRIPDTPFIPELSYWEMLVYARRGGSIVHPRAVRPVMGNGAASIPMRIVNTRTGASETTITGTGVEGVKAIGIKDDQTYVSIRDPEMDQPGVLRDITEVFAENGLSIDVLGSETPTVEMTIDGQVPDAVRNTLRERFHQCMFIEGVSTVVLVGHEVRKDRAAVHSLLDATAEKRHTLAEGTDSLTAVVPGEDGDALVKTLHAAIMQR